MLGKVKGEIPTAPHEHQVRSIEGSEENLAPEEVKNALIESLSEAATLDPEKTQEKTAIINNLPDDLVEQIHAHMMAVDIENSRYGKGPTTEYRKQLGVLKGELFERLVQAHPREFFQDVELPLPDPENPKKNLRLKGYNPDNILENELLTFLHDPERFDVPRGDSNRNPDLVFTDIRRYKSGESKEKESEVQEVSAVGEAKVGKIDYRAFQQLKSFEETFSERWEGIERFKENLARELYAEFQEEGELWSEIVDTVATELRENFSGKRAAQTIQKELAKKAQEIYKRDYQALVRFERLRVSKRLGKVLIVTEEKEIPSDYDRKRTNTEGGNTAARTERVRSALKEKRKIAERLVKKEDFRGPDKDRKIQECVALLTSPEVKIIKAKFSRKEIEAMSKTLFEIVKERYPSNQ